jgi:hypothetical protein
VLWSSLFFRVGFPLIHCGWWLLIFCWIWNIHFPLIRVEISKFFSGCLKSLVLRNCQYLWNVADFCHIKFCLWTHLSAIMWKEHAKYSFIAYFGLTKKKWFSPLCLFWAFEFWLWFWIGSLLHMVIRIWLFTKASMCGVSGVFSYCFCRMFSYRCLCYILKILQESKMPWLLKVLTKLTHAFGPPCAVQLLMG